MVSIITLTVFKTNNSLYCINLKGESVMNNDNCIDTIENNRSFHAPALSWGGWIGDGKRLAAKEANKIATILLTWQRRKTMRYLIAEMDERILKDIGCTREEIKKEAAKPFWKE